MINLILGDCVEKMKELPAGSVDAIVTDPPYGLEFMGKEWDRFAPSDSNRERWKGKRQPMMATDVSIPGTGFTQLPTSFSRKQNKKCKKCGHYAFSGTPCTCEEPDWEVRPNKFSLGFYDFCLEWATECLRVLKPGGHLLSFGGTRTYHRMACAIEDAGFEIRDMIEWVYGSGFPKSLNIGKKVPDWEGWGTALKPAHEPIVLARKPISEATIAANVLEHGTGGLNIDECRILYEDGETPNVGGRGGHTRGDGYGFKPMDDIPQAGNRTATFGTQETTSGGDGSGGWEANTTGRFPANLIHDGSEEATVGMAGKSSYFYCPKASKKERNEGLDGFDVKRPDDRTETGMGAFEEKGVQPQKNHHPTVKPVRLMEYLITLITPPNGTVLDPFMGSGTTGVAAVRLGRDFVGIEIDKEYMAIAKARIDAAKEKINVHP